MVRLRVATIAAAGLLALTSAFGQQPGAKPAEPGVAAYIGDQKISLAELDAKILKTNMKLAQQLYDARKAAVDQAVIDKLLGDEAKGKGMTVDQLLQQKVAGSMKPVTDADISAFYEANKARMGTRTLEQVTGQIRSQLAGQREADARNALLADLKAKSNVRVVLEVPRVEIGVAANDPVKGPATAKVTVIEFSEFQ